MTIANYYLRAANICLNRLTDRMKSGRFCREKRTLQVLQSNYNDVMRWCLWAVEVILTTMVVFGVCGSVWTEGAGAIRIFLVAMLSFYVLVTVWKGLGDVYQNSVEVLATWSQQEGNSLLLRKFIRSTRPVRVEIGSYFYADRSMVLTLLDIITQNTFSLLLAA